MIRTEGSDDLERIAAALKEAGDKDLQKQVSAAMRKVSRPFGRRILDRGADDLPQRGGLADRVASMGRVGVSNSLNGRVASVQVILRNKGADLKSIDAGTVRHRVFGRGPWVRQAIRPGAFTRQFEKDAPQVREEVTKAAQDVLNDVARKA